MSQTHTEALQQFCLLVYVIAVHFAAYSIFFPLAVFVETQDPNDDKTGPNQNVDNIVINIFVVSRSSLAHHSNCCLFEKQI